MAVHTENTKCFALFEFVYIVNTSSAFRVSALAPSGFVEWVLMQFAEF